MNETASGGVSRSGRVRKKTAKLMEMENEVQPLLPTPKTATAKSVNQIQTPSSTPKNISKSVIQDQDIDDDQPPKKKIKIKLSLGPSPSIVPDQIIEEPKTEPKTQSKTEPKIEPKIEDHNVKKGLIPPLKIPKSKIAGALSPQPASSMNVTENQVPSLEESHSSGYELKIDTAIKEEESQSEQSLVAPKKIIFNNKPTKIKLNFKSDKSVKTPDSNAKQSNFNGPIPALKSPKLAKPKIKQQHETPANKLFKQITSGISSESMKKKSKTTPAKTFVMDNYDEEEDIDESPLRAKKRPSKIVAEKKDEKKNKKVENEKPKKKRATVITAYMLWSKENRSKIQQTCPPMDFAGVSRKLGEIWRSLPKNEKTQWKRKAQKLAGKGQSALISTGKPIIKNQNKDISTNENPYSTSFHSNQNDDDLLSDEPSPIGTTPIDVAAHLRLLGESLNIIGQRLKEHSGQIAVSGSLSVLLDSTLCAIGPLLCLTKLDPNLDGCSSEVHKKTLDNIAYIMPGI